VIAIDRSMLADFAVLEANGFLLGEEDFDILTVIHDGEWMQECHKRLGLKAIVMVKSSREISGKIEQETRFYTTPLVMPAHLIGPAIHSHWAIENRLH
jgi:hypothetical protein